MVGITRVNVCPVLDEIPRDGDVGGEVEGCLSIAAARMHDGVVAGHERIEPIEHAEARGGVGVHPCASLDEPGCERRFAGVEHAEAARPPMATLVDVRPVCEQEVDHRAALPVDGGGEDRGTECPAGHRVVESRGESGMPIECPPGGVQVVHLDRHRENVERIRGGQERGNVLLQFGPAGEAVLSRHHELRVVQAEIARLDRRTSSEARVVRAEPRERQGIAGPDCIEQFARLLLLLFEVGDRGQRATHARRIGHTSSFVDAWRPRDRPKEGCRRATVLQVGAALSADRTRPWRATIHSSASALIVNL